jgi:hypothetical protein
LRRLDRRLTLKSGLYLAYPFFLPCRRCPLVEAPSAPIFINDSLRMGRHAVA